MVDTFCDKAGEFYKEVASNFLMAILCVFYIVIAALGILGVIAGVVMGIWWIMWTIWCFVMPQIAYTMPLGFQTPEYWTFAACLVILVWVRNFLAKLIHGPSIKDEYAD